MKTCNTKKGQSGQAMLTAILFFTFISSAIMFGIINPIIKQVRIGLDLIQSKESFFLAESATEDVLYRLQSRKIVDATEYLSLNGAFATTTIGNITNGKEVIVTASKRESIRKVKTTVALGTGVAFHYGVQAGQGGFNLENTSFISGNLFSSGPVTGSGNMIYGDVISAGPAGLINNIHATGSAYAHTIQNSTIDKDAFYVTKTSTVVGGVSYPGSPDQPIVDLPISDAQITEFEDEALVGGIISSPCPYKITTSRTLGPTKITCSLEISGSPTITVNGPIWVTGDISISNSAIIKIANSLGSAGVPIIAHNPSNRTTSSAIDLKNTVQFVGSGSSGSYILLISQNNSAELGGTEEAISMDNSASGALILYASHGLIAIQNTATLKEVTAYKIKTKNSSNVIYDRGLSNTLFTSGPAGGYELLSWEEIR